MLNGDLIGISASFSDGSTLTAGDWTLELINPDGNPNADTNQLYRLTLMAGSAVPEPATWAMMLAGFGAVGFAMRRSRKVAVSFA